jgi:hypothetical protein
LAGTYLDVDHDSKDELQEVSQDEQGMFSAYCMANLDSLDKMSIHQTTNQMYMTWLKL